MEDVIGKYDDFSEQFVVGGVTQFLERRHKVCWAISATAGAVDHRVNSLKIRRPGTVTDLQGAEPTPPSSPTLATD